MTLTVNERLEDPTVRGLGSYWGCDLDKKRVLPCRFEQVKGDVYGADSIVTHLEPQTMTNHRRQQPRSSLSPPSWDPEREMQLHCDCGNRVEVRDDTRAPEDYEGSSKPRHYGRGQGGKDTASHEGYTMRSS
jgi:hypothetical protein